MKILYGVVGEGMGHAMRSRVVLEHLVSQGHEVEIMASGRAVDFLSKRFADVNRIHGLHMIYEENRVRRGRTLWSNVVTGAAGLPGNIAAYFELLRDFSPDAVVSDFESWTHLFGSIHRLPVISIDNMQIIHRAEHPPEVIAGHEPEFQVTKAFIKAKLPGCKRYLVTTFFYPPLRKPDTSLHAPILRPEILAAAPTRGDHLLVYQTAEGHGALLDALRASGRECRIYGMKRDLKEEMIEGSLRYRPFSEKGFIDDLASCRAVIAGGGFTLMGEAVYLRKPMLAVPWGGSSSRCSTPAGSSAWATGWRPPPWRIPRWCGPSSTASRPARRPSPGTVRAATGSCWRSSTASSTGRPSGPCNPRGSVV